MQTTLKENISARAWLFFCFVNVQAKKDEKWSSTDRRDARPPGQSETDVQEVFHRVQQNGGTCWIEPIHCAAIKKCSFLFILTKSADGAPFQWYLIRLDANLLQFATIAYSISSRKMMLFLTAFYSHVFSLETAAPLSICNFYKND